MPTHLAIWVRCIALSALVCPQFLYAQSSPVVTKAIWHCSRNAAEPENTAQASTPDEFKLSSMDTIGVTLADLVNVYSGLDVRLGNMPLIACFMPGQDMTTKEILMSLDLKPHVLQKLSVKSAIVQSQLIMVTDEEQMQACLHKHFPSFGYLTGEHITETYAPCF